MILIPPGNLAEQLLTTAGTLAKWRLKGCGPKFVRIGPRLVGYRAEDVEEWLNSNIHSSTSGGGKGGRKSRGEIPQEAER